MANREWMDKALSLALERGCDAAEIYYASTESFSVNAADGDFDRYEVSVGGGLNLRVTLNGRDGYAYTETFGDAETLVSRAMDNARIIGVPDEHPMQGVCRYETVGEAPSPLARLPVRDKIELSLLLERESLAADARAKRAVECTVGNERRTIAIKNTRGLDVSRVAAVSYLYVMPMLEAEGGEVHTGFAFRSGKDALDAAGCAREAVADAADKFGAKPVPSGAYRVILKNNAAADLLSAFVPMFSAEETQKGLSLLAGRENTAIGAPCVTILDDPFHPSAPRAFDAEGTPSRTKAVVENGVLKTLLHNLKTAKKVGLESTGNAVRASASAPVSAGPSVLYAEPGKTPFTELVALLGDGLVITGVEGEHAGVDPVSGGFSLKAEGYLVEGGARVRPVSQITVAGSFLTLLGAVERLGADLFLSMHHVGSPSILISSLKVAGE